MRAVATRFNERPSEASRPFDAGRDGFVLGEGAWILTLESEAHARARGARIYAFVDGYASTCDAYHRVQMDPEGHEIVRAMTEAMAKAGRVAEDIGYVNFHGTSTMLTDAVEARCVSRVLADNPRIMGSSTKSMIGHPQGASGAAGVVATALALSRGVLPPTINLTDPDPTLTGIDFIPQVARPMQVEAALCNCLGFGSKNSALVLGRAD
jgi:3-oxoacyl-[acyl-carrier-protein] synthase II